jgi:hypothetical protein
MLQMRAGFLVVHVLVMSAQGLPRGPHEHVMLHIPEFLPDEDGEVFFGGSWLQGVGAGGVGNGG